jgi:hypothetical protein
MKDTDDFAFQFEQPQTAPPQNDEPGSAGQTPTASLICSCPACGADVETQPADADQPLAATCPACNNALSIIRESSAYRVRRRSQKLNCANCGSLLDHHSHCTSCGTLFPDYYVAVKPEEVLRKARTQRLSDLRQSLGRFNISLYFDFFQNSTQKQRQRRPEPAAVSSPSLLTPRVQRLLISLLIATVLVGGLSYAFHVYMKQQQFAKGYAKAIYSIKTGADFNQKVCDRIVTEWKTALESGAAFSPGQNDEEKARTDKIRGEVAKIMGQMDNPPKRFAQAHEKLIQLRGAYQKTTDLASSPPETLQAFTTSVDQAESGFKTAAQDLKGSMPDALKEELERAKQKYRGMKDF